MLGLNCVGILDQVDGEAKQARDGSTARQPVGVYPETSPDLERRIGHEKSERERVRL